MHTYKAVQQGANGPYNLIKDFFAASCPKMLPVLPRVIESGLNKGQVQMAPMNMPCNTSCPFATITEEEQFKDNAEGGGTKSIGKKPMYSIRCEGGFVKLLLDEVKPFPKMEAK